MPNQNAFVILDVINIFVYGNVSSTITCIMKLFKTFRAYLRPLKKRTDCFFSE